MSIGSFFKTIGRFLVDGFAGVGMVVGGTLGALGGGLSWLFTKVTGKKIAFLGGGFKHTVLASALGWGSLLAAIGGWSPGSIGDEVRTGFVGPTVHDVA